MRAQATYLLHELSESFWFLPLLMTVAAVALSATTLALDRGPSSALYQLLPWSEGLGRSNARLIMSTVSGSIITAASLVFSVTLVALTLAARQLGPRLLSMFMRDRITQVVIGTFAATFVFALLVLASLGDPSDSILVPRASIFVALFLTLLSFTLLIAFIHHLAKSLNADVILARLAENLSAQLAGLISQQREGCERNNETRPQWEPGGRICSDVSGYVQTIDCKTLVDLAFARSTEILLLYRAGDFVHKGETIALTKHDIEDLEKFESTVRSSIVFGPKRTDAEDPEFVFQAIVEIALRALSSGVNDPYTARTCIDWLGEALAQVLKSSMPDQIHCDRHGTIRLYAVSHTQTGFFDAALNEIRQAAEGNVPVLNRLAETLERLTRLAKTEDQKKIIQRHFEMLVRSCKRSVSEPLDREHIQQCLNRIEETISRPVEVT